MIDIIELSGLYKDWLEKGGMGCQEEKTIAKNGELFILAILGFLIKWKKGLISKNQRENEYQKNNLKGKILNNDFPFDEADPSGIFQALILYTKPSVEKNNTEVCVFTESVCTTESSSLVLIPVLPFPPLFCCLTPLKDPLLMYPW